MRFTAHEAQRPGQRAAAAALPSGSCRAEGVAPQGALGGVPLCGRGTGTRGQSRPGTGDRSESPRGGGKVTAAESSRLSSSVIVAGFRAVP